MTINNYLIALFLTVLIELLLAYIFFWGNRKILKPVLLVNLITHPIFWIFLWGNNLLVLIPFNLFLIITLELFIVFVEFLLLKMVLDFNDLKILLLSFLMNLGSFLFGFILF